MKRLLLFALFGIQAAFAQNFSFNFNTTGQRVCLVEAEVNTDAPSVTVKLLDAASNTNKPTDIYRRTVYGNGSDWSLVASGLAPGTTQWTDTDVSPGQVWEYQAKRHNTWFYAAVSHDATGYAIGSLLSDKTNYQGRMILLVADDVPAAVGNRYERLKRELTGDGWFVQELIVPKATSWDSGNAVVTIKNQIASTYNSAAADDKPKALFILGHVPMPRCGSTSVTAPDAHDQNKGARGCDGFYADMDGVYTDSATFNPGGLQTALAVNLPGDFKWDQDFFASDLEMAFGRVDFYDVTDIAQTESQLLQTYLDKLSAYKNLATGFDMGNKTAFYLGYDNSNDGSYRSLAAYSKSANLYQNPSDANHAQWVSQNGPFKIYMQNAAVPDIGQWTQYGMNATVFSSDQSYWGWNDVPQANYIYSRSRSLLGLGKCLVTLWTTTGVNTFYQACSGDAFGLAVREVMNHNAANNKTQRPPQNWDTADWYNRTHFSYNGDPTLRLFQMKPAQNIAILNVDNAAVLSWQASSEAGVIGYHVYRSASEFGKFERITSNPVNALSFPIPNYAQNDWFMVRPVKIAESGCGSFYLAGMGIFAKGEFALGVATLSPNAFKMAPNPARHAVSFSSDEIAPAKLEIVNLQGQTLLERKMSGGFLQVDVSSLSSGAYLVRIASEKGVVTKKLIVE